MKDETQTVAFCDIVKSPQIYFDKSIRLTAKFQQATEAQYLTDGKCVLSHDEQIGVGYFNTNERERDLINGNIRQIRTPEYGGQAMVTVVGALRNSSRRDFAWYQYRFDILRFENVSRVTVPYEGKLQVSVTYLAAVRGNRRDGLSLVVPLRMREFE